MKEIDWKIDWLEPYDLDHWSSICDCYDYIHDDVKEEEDKLWCEWKKDKCKSLEEIERTYYLWD